MGPNVRIAIDNMAEAEGLTATVLCHLRKLQSTITMYVSLLTKIQYFQSKKKKKRKGKSHHISKAYR